MFVAFASKPNQPPNLQELLLLEGWNELKLFFQMWGHGYTIEQLQIMFPNSGEVELIKAWLWQHVVRIR